MSKDDSASAPRWKDDVQHAVLRVDGGRGFIVVDPHSDAHVVITAAHCLPELPPCHALSDTHERTYEKLLGRLMGKIRDDCTVWAECLFADPVADVAVLGEPDHPDLLERQQDYRKLIETKRFTRLKLVKCRDHPSRPSRRTKSGARHGCCRSITNGFRARSAASASIVVLSWSVMLRRAYMVGCPARLLSMTTDAL